MKQSIIGPERQVLSERVCVRSIAGTSSTCSEYECSIPIKSYLSERQPAFTTVDIVW